MFSPREEILMWLFVAALMFSCQSSESGECNDKLAMPSKRTQDIDITSSSDLSSNHAPAFARLDGPRAWCSAPGDKTPYIQITWDEEKLITAMQTQGSFYDFSWARRYEVRYLIEEGEWTSYNKSLIGNRNTRSLKKNYFKPAIRTQSVQIYPKNPIGVMMYSSAPMVPCLRLELYGCSAPEPCHPLRMPNNGKIHNNDTKHGALVSFSCDTGFKLYGSRQITCVDGRWNGSVPTCKGYCKDPGPLRNGSVLGDDYSSGSSIQIRCNVGYRLRGSQIIYCVNGTWNETIPECKIIKCRDPGKPSNGKQIVKKGFVYGGRIKFECDRDYTLDGAHTTYCQADKSWTSPVPRCLAPCEGPADPIHGLKRGRDFRHGRSVSFDCYSGYQRIGAASISCNDGKWDNRVPMCKGVCGRPRTTPRVRLHGNSYLDGDKATFSCYGNHDLFGKAELSCVGRAWDFTVPECKARCTLIGKPQNGFYVKVTREGDIIKHGEWINYGCIGGYTLVGNGTQECSDGRWTNPIPSCKANCLDPGAPYQGKTIDQDFRHGRTVRFTCPRNYTIEGVPAIKCTDGQWNNNKPSCKAPCPDPGVPYQGKTIDQDFRHSRTVRFTCPRNYVMEGMAAIKCTDGQWNNNKPSCKALCGEPPPVLNAQDRYQLTGTAASVFYVCNQGYSLFGPTRRTCLANGTWDGVKPFCFKMCSFPNIPSSMYIVQPINYRRVYKTGEMIILGCKTGLKKIGDPIRACVNEKWTQLSFQCGESTWCARTNTKAFRYCTKRTCTSNGNCKSNEKCLCDGDCGMSCVRNNLKCKPPPKPKNSQWKLSHGFNFGSVVTYRCTGQYKLRGSAKRTCRAIGLWDGQNARCSYSLFGPTRRTCRANGTWDGVEPYCFKVCSLPRIPSSMHIVQPINYQRVFKTGEMIILGCKKGLTKRSNGDPIRVCVNGKWTQSSFKCGGLEKRDKRCVKMLRRLLRIAPPGSIINIRLSRATIRCGEGYMEGNETLFCFRGKWIKRKQSKCIPDYSPCGVSPVDFRAMIAGGSKSKKGWWPWHVGIYKLNYLAIPQLVCGGALISSQWALTAGHCFSYKNMHTWKFIVKDNASLYHLKVGDHNLKKGPTAEKSEKTVTLKKVYVHPGFIHEKYVNDIALVKLEQKVEFNKFVRTVCLPEKNEGDLVIPTKYGYVAGWGATKALKPAERVPDHRRYSHVLKHLAYEIQQNPLCGKRSALPFNSTVSFCAGDGKGGNGTCHGDSGGAFVREGKRGNKYRWIVTGLVSWGEGCAQANQYEYYTRVYPFIDWIKKVVAKNH